MVTYNYTNADKIWKAISDGKRRTILDALSERAMTTGQLVELLPNIGRTAVLKHIGVLHDATLIHFKREGRLRWNHINVEPIKHICSPWLNYHIKGIAGSAKSLKQLAERS